jgi:hypothetical protein
VEVATSKALPVVLPFCLCLAWAAALAAQSVDTREAPSQFTLDAQTAARLWPQLIAQSSASSGHYSVGRIVFERLVQQAVPPAGVKLAWQLRIVESDRLNAYSSPDGNVYVETGLARMAGSSSGLWAAILAHEIAHVVRRDWARRYLYQRSLENEGSASIVIGDPGLPASEWTDPQKASQDLARFCRRLEIEADRDGLMLMARAGYHPDFVPALHHLLHAQGPDAPAVSLYSMHPCWEERDRELSRAYVEASIEFEHRWPEWYASPGGNPPVLVFAEDPRVKKTGAGAWEIQVPMRCQNLVGAVEVVLRASSSTGKGAHAERTASPDDAAAGPEIRQISGCTSPRTTVTFNFDENVPQENPAAHWTDIYVLDASGAVLSRADLPKLPH